MSSPEDLPPDSFIHVLLHTTLTPLSCTSLLLASARIGIDLLELRTVSTSSAATDIAHPLHEKPMPFDHIEKCVSLFPFKIADRVQSERKLQRGSQQRDSIAEDVKENLNALRPNTTAKEEKPLQPGSFDGNFVKGSRCCPTLCICGFRCVREVVTTTFITSYRRSTRLYLRCVKSVR
eukprot:GHVH01008446.1.p1 GENE.GHVH01008446.1~~GHVH01008446.1.p1  ORF type:complete len:178 (+),score=11.39 GHVH01008446.1:86-619(+)